MLTTVRRWLSQRLSQSLGDGQRSTTKDRQDSRTRKGQVWRGIHGLWFGVLCSYRYCLQKLSRRKAVYLLFMLILTALVMLAVQDTKTLQPDLQNPSYSNGKHTQTSSSTNTNTKIIPTHRKENVTGQKTTIVEVDKSVNGETVIDDVHSPQRRRGVERTRVNSANVTQSHNVSSFPRSERQQQQSARQMKLLRLRQQFMLFRQRRTKELARERVEYEPVYTMVDREASRGPNRGPAGEATRGETRHVFFLKVHKAASTTVMNVLYRFALSRRLSVALPSRGNVLSERGKKWLSRLLSSPVSHFRFDILCNHVVFHEPSIRRILPSDAKFIGIVRKPFQQFLSAFFYYRDTFGIPYLRRISDRDPVTEYLQSPVKYEPESRQDSFTHNRMLFDFGMEPEFMRRAGNVSDYMGYLEETFDLVMISERFDESMVLLRRRLGWRLQDVLYIRNNVFKKRVDTAAYTAEQQAAHKEFNAADYALYEHFSRLFQTKVDTEGASFSEEVAAFVSLREKAEAFCQSSQSVAEGALTLSATSWTKAFSVSREDCALMTMPEVPFVNLMRYRHYQLWFH